MAWMRVVALFVLGLVLVDSVRGAESESRLKQLAKLRRAAIDATEREAATLAYMELFEDVSNGELRELTNDPDTGIAAYARWKAKRSTDPELAAASHPERFVGFVEGRTGLNCPANWANWLITSSLEMSDWSTSALRTYGPLGLIEIQDKELGLKPGEGVLSWKCTTEIFHTIELVGRRFYVPQNTQLTDARLLIKETSIPLHASFIDALRGEKLNGHNNLRGHIAGEATFVAAWTFDAVQFPLFCLETKTGKVRWTTEVWGSRVHGLNIFGHYHHHVELAVGRRVVGVFGLESGNSYVEGFELASGKPVFRFNQHLWETDAALDGKTQPDDAAAVRAKTRLDNQVRPRSAVERRKTRTANRIDDEDVDGPDKWWHSPKYRAIMRNLGVD